VIHNYLTNDEILTIISVLNTYSPASKSLGITIFQLLLSLNNSSAAQNPSAILSRPSTGCDIISHRPFMIRRPRPRFPPAHAHCFASCNGRADIRGRRGVVADDVVGVETDGVKRSSALTCGVPARCIVGICGGFKFIWVPAFVVNGGIRCPYVVDVGVCEDGGGE
jgi:hypothetical protein